MNLERTTVLTPAEVAAAMRVSGDTVLRLLRTGRLRGHKFGKQWRITRADLDAYLATSTAPPGDRIPPDAVPRR